MLQHKLLTYFQTDLDSLKSQLHMCVLGGIHYGPRVTILQSHFILLLVVENYMAFPIAIVCFHLSNIVLGYFHMFLMELDISVAFLWLLLCLCPIILGETTTAIGCKFSSSLSRIQPNRKCVQWLKCSASSQDSSLCNWVTTWPWINHFIPFCLPTPPATLYLNWR